MWQFYRNYQFSAFAIGFLLLAMQLAADAQRGEGRNKPVQPTPEDVNPIAMQLDRAAPGNFDPDTTLEIQVTISAPSTEGITALGLYETPPQGWLYGDIRAISNELPVVAKQNEDSGVIEFAWINTPVMPLTFAYTLHVPPPSATSSGMQFISGQVEYRTNSGKLVSPPVITQLQGKDVMPPEIILLGPNPYEMVEGDTFQEPGYTATDAVDGDLTSQVKVSGNVNNNQPGTYQRTYTVRDKAGNEAIKTRVVRVSKKPEAKPNPNTQGRNNPPQNNNRNRGGVSVGTAFDNFQNEFEGENGGKGIDAETPANADANASNTPRHPHDTGQPSRVDPSAPKTVYAIPSAAVQSPPERFNDKGEKITNNVPSVNLDALKDAAAASDDSSDPSAGSTKEDSPEIIAKADSAPGTSLPYVPAAATAVPAIVVPDAGIAVTNPSLSDRIMDSLNKLTRQELTGLAGLALAFVVLSLVGFMFWRGAYRPPTRH